MYTPPVKGRFLKRSKTSAPEQNNGADLVLELKNLKEDIVKVFNEELTKLEDKQQEFGQEFENIKNEFEDIKQIQKGEDGQDVDPNEVAQIVLDNIKIPKDGEPGKDADEKKIIKEVLKKVPTKSDLKIIQEKVEIDPMSVIDKIMSLPEEKRKKLQLGTSNINGLEQTIHAFQSQLGRGYLHGGGLSTVSHDATLTGLGTPQSPLSVVGGGAIALTNTHIFVGNSSNVATDVALTLSATPGTFSLANTGILTMPDATTSLRGLLSSTDWNTFNNKEVPLTFSTGLTRTVNTVTVNTTQNITKLSNLIGNGLVKTTGSDGTLGTATNDVTQGDIGIVVDGQGGVITTGQKGYIKIPYACTITAWTIIASPSGSCVFDVWKSTSVPTVTNTITASAKPTLTSSTLATSTTLTGWTTSLSAGDIIGWNVDSATTVTWAILELKITKTT